MTHTLKTWPEYFAPIKSGEKTFEARKNDRDFQVGDTLLLKEWILEGHFYSGEEVTRRVSYILKGPGFGIEDGHCILAIKPLDT